MACDAELVVAVDQRAHLGGARDQATSSLYGSFQRLLRETPELWSRMAGNGINTRYFLNTFSRQKDILEKKALTVVRYNSNG